MEKVKSVTETLGHFRWFQEEGFMLEMVSTGKGKFSQRCGITL